MGDKVSVILAVYNEEDIIEDTIKSLLRQKADEFEVEILVVDGRSDDKTPQIVDKLIEGNDAVKYILNEARITPVAFNLGIKSASGNYIAILGAHSEYADDYLQVCYDEVKRTGAVGCSGKVVPKVSDLNPESELCLAILSSPIGVSKGSFRTREAGFVESIPYGVFKKEAFDRVGLYNEKLIRNQDNDMNSRILEAGFRLYLTDKTYCHYFPKKDLKALNKYAFKTGLWNAKTLRIGSYTMRPMHYVPFLFLVYNILAIVFVAIGFILKVNWLVWLAAGPLILYFIIAFYYSWRSNFRFKENFFRFPFAVYRFHLNYGTGTLKGFLKTE